MLWICQHFRESQLANGVSATQPTSEVFGQPVTVKPDKLVTDDVPPILPAVAFLKVTGVLYVAAIEKMRRHFPFARL